MMVKPINTQAIETATGLSWKEWCLLLDEAGASACEHNEIVRKARDLRVISGWWAQSVAVAYEQHIGRRLPGQMSDGSFSASVSRTVAGSLQPTHASWCEFVSGHEEISGQKIAKPPTTSVTPKRHYWRCKFDDGSTAVIGMEALNKAKVLIAVEHNKLEVASRIDEMKRVWGGLLDACFKK